MTKRDERMQFIVALLRYAPQGRDDRVGVVDAAAPGAAADGLQGGPEAGVVGQVGVGRERRVRRSAGEDARALRSAPNSTPSAADQVDRAFEADAVDDDPDRGRRRGPGRSGRRPAPRGRRGRCRRRSRRPRTGRRSRTATCLPNERCLQRRGDLVDLLHARPHRPAADQDEDVAGLDRVGRPAP